MRTAVLALGALACLGAPAQAEVASYYGKELAGRRTASGERFNPSAMTAAHRTLRFGTRVRVTNSRNGRSVVVRINDRGPFVKGRSIDLSSGAARAIGMGGSAHVRLQVIR
jgi:rare lipoprotein A